MSKLHEAWLGYKAEEYPDETESEVLTPLAAAFEAGWLAAEGAMELRRAITHPEALVGAELRALGMDPEKVAEMCLAVIKGAP